MDITCIEVEGAIHQPENVFPLDNFWIIPATKNAEALEMKQCKVILASQNNYEYIFREADTFVFCYQFLFFMSYVYYYSSVSQSFSYFTESGADINTIADNLSKRYETYGSHKISFDKINTFHTKLPHKINFAKFYNLFTKKYDTDSEFRNIIDLFLYTIGSENKYYNNVFQKISQLQTVFETILGKREEEKKSCGMTHSKEDWKTFITRKLKEKGIENQKDIDLTVKIQNTLNRSARVKYTHYSKQLNTRKKFVEDIRYGTHHSGKSNYTTNFHDILSNTLKVKDWSAIDWENSYFLYQIIIKQLIFLEYFNK